MKSFNEWLEENNLNEISSGLLYGARNAAMERPDERGQRLAQKFDRAAKQKEYDNDVEEIEKEYEKFITRDNSVANIKIGGESIDLILKQAHTDKNSQTPHWNLQCRAMKSGDFGDAMNFNSTLGEGKIYNCMLRLEKSENSPIWSLYYTSQKNSNPRASDIRNTNVASWVGRGELVKSIDRKSAIIISRFINSHGGEIKPTDLPLR